MSNPMNTYLLDAARTGADDFLAMCLRRGADPDAQTLDVIDAPPGSVGFGVLHWLVEGNHETVLRRMIASDDRTFSVDAIDATGQTAWHRAAQASPELFLDLWHWRATEIPNHDGKTALDLFMERNHDIVERRLFPPKVLPPLPSSEASSVHQGFPDSWLTAPHPDASIPGEASLSPEAWQRRVWATERPGMLESPQDSSVSPEEPWVVDLGSMSTLTPETSIVPPKSPSSSVESLCMPSEPYADRPSLMTTTFGVNTPAWVERQRERRDAYPFDPPGFQPLQALIPSNHRTTFTLAPKAPSNDEA